MLSFADRLSLLREQRGSQYSLVMPGSVPAEHSCVGSMDDGSAPPTSAWKQSPDPIARCDVHIEETAPGPIGAESNHCNSLVAAPSSPCSMPESADVYSGILSTYSGAAPLTPIQPKQQQHQQPTICVNGSTDSRFDFIPLEFPGSYILVSECVARAEPVYSPTRYQSPSTEGTTPYRAALLQNAHDIMNNRRITYMWKGSQPCCLRSDVISELRPMRPDDM
jgi:hypothetical protein